MELNLEGRKALITGGSRGIGLAVAKALAAEGCHLHLVARSAADLDRARAAIAEAHGVEVWPHAADLGQPGEARRVAAAAGAVDILVNNAGALPRGTLEEIDESAWRDAWNLKLYGYIDLTRAVYPAMKARGRGAIVNVIGVGGERPTAAYIAGGTANAALMAFTRALGGESVDHGVRVVGVNPGMVATERMVQLLSSDAIKQFGDASRWRELLAGRPFGRAATAEEVARLVVFLASDQASYVSGTIVTVDGGGTTRQPPL